MFAKRKNEMMQDGIRIPPTYKNKTDRYINNL